MLSVGCDYDVYAVGPGLGASIGYQPFPHLTVECQYSHGWTSDNGTDYALDNVNLMVAVWAY